jgi:hypothetical protein
MEDLLLTLLHLTVMTAKLGGPGGVRAVIAENLLLKQQRIGLRRARQRAPNLTFSDRLLCGFWSLFISPGRIRKVAIGVRPSTLLAFHRRRFVASTTGCSRRAVFEEAWTESELTSLSIRLPARCSVISRGRSCSVPRHKQLKQLKAEMFRSQAVAPIHSTSGLSRNYTRCYGHQLERTNE